MLVQRLRAVVPSLSVVTRASLRAFGAAFESARLTLDAQRDHDIRGRAALHHRQAHRAHGVGRRMCAWQGCEVQVHGPVPRGPVVLVSNHLNWLDPMVLSSVLPIAGLSKAEMCQWPVVGPAACAVGCIPVERGDAWSGMLAMRAALRALTAGVTVLNFCEGTTSEGRDVLPFRAGIFRVARLAGVAVVPVALRYEPADACWPTDEVLVRNFMRVARHPRWTAQVCFGEPLRFDDETPDPARAEAARQAVRHLAGLAGG